MSLHALAPGGSGDAAAGWNTGLIGASAWFDGANDWLTRENGTANGLEQWMIFYLKPIPDGAEGRFYGITFQNGVRSCYYGWLADGTMLFYDQPTGSSVLRFDTEEHFENVTTWLPIIVHTDPGNATAADRLQVWSLVEGVIQPLTNTYGFSNTATSTVHATSGLDFFLGQGSQGLPWTGSIAAVCRIDGSLAGGHADLFTTDENGWFLPLSDAQYAALADTAGGESYYLGSAIGDGTDASTNGNDWTPVSMSHAANGSADTPSNNICHWNPRTEIVTGSFTVSEGGQFATGSGSGATGPTGTMSFDAEDSDGFYFEMTGDSYIASVSTGIISADISRTMLTSPYAPTAGEGHFVDARGAGGGNRWWYNDTVTDTGVSWAAGDVLGFFVRSGKFWAAINGTWVASGNPNADSNPLATGITGWWKPFFHPVNGGDARLNCGQVSYSYTPPTGAKNITAANVRASHSGLVPEDYHKCGKYTGTGAALAITGLGFQPGLVMIDPFTGSNDHALFTVTNGVGQYWRSANANAETTDANSLTSFDSDGFTLGTSSTFNTSSTVYHYAAWALDDPVTDSTGDIESEVAMAPTGAIAVVRYTAPGSPAAGNTVGIGAALDAHPGKPPDAIIFKRLDAGSGTTLYYHKMRFEVSDPETDYIPISNTGGIADNAGVQNDTAPTASAVTLGTNANVQAAKGVHEMILIWDIPGISRVSGYDGNGNTGGRGPFVDTRGRSNYHFERTTTAAREAMYLPGETVPQFGANGSDSARNWHYHGEASSGRNTAATCARDGTGLWQESTGTNNHNGSGQFHAFFCFNGRDNRQLFP